jgi:hypothetical protein
MSNDPQKPVHPVLMDWCAAARLWAGVLRPTAALAALVSGGNSLAAGSWETLRFLPASDFAREQQVTDTSAGTNAMRFYRLISP